MRNDTRRYLGQEDRSRLRDLIGQHSGLGQPLLGNEALERAVARRLSARGLAGVADYWPLLEGAPNGEINNLVQLLTNKETFFFRELHQFEALRRRVLPELVAARKFPVPVDPSERAPLRLWSAGCATGEEPYSLAITVLEYQRRHGPIEAEILGTDIDADAIEVARRGHYGERALRLVPSELRERYFRFDGSSYRVGDEVARLVTFSVHNLAVACCPADLSDLDVIFCRNVTIYFGSEARDRLNARLAGSLREGGYLFVASAETMGHNQGRLELLSEGKTFLFRKGRSPGQQALTSISKPLKLQPREAQPVAEGPGPRRRVERPAPTPVPPAVDSPLERAQAAFRYQNYEAALRELDRLPEEQPLVLDAWALRAAILLQTGRLDEAEEACQILLAHDPWRTDAHFLMGMIAHHRGQVREAIEALKTVVYLQPEHPGAHFYLAEAHQALGQWEHARREYKNTLNVLRMNHRPGKANDMRLSGLEDDMLRQACEVNLARSRRHMGSSSAEAGL